MINIVCKCSLLNRCGHLNIGDQIISVNGISLVGLPISSCQTQIKVALVAPCRSRITVGCSLLECETSDHGTARRRPLSTRRRSTHSTTGYKISGRCSSSLLSRSSLIFFFPSQLGFSVQNGIVSPMSMEDSLSSIHLRSV
jgi:hypothetical protein